jgi:hypothetical protein
MSGPTMSGPTMLDHSYQTPPGVDSTKGSGPGSQVDSGQLRKIKKEIFEVLIFHMKKLRNNSCGYKIKDYFKRFFILH